MNSLEVREMGQFWQVYFLLEKSRLSSQRNWVYEEI
jgi:hypothetical protein